MEKSSGTRFLNPLDIRRKWFVIDASGCPLGRVATRVASVLRGKHRPYYTPHQEVGDYVVVINARHATLSGRKTKNKQYYRHSGYPGGLKKENYQKAVMRKPSFPMERAVLGMLPRGILGRKLFQNVKIYPDAVHPHAAQQPEELTI